MHAHRRSTGGPGGHRTPCLPLSGGRLGTSAVVALLLIGIVGLAGCQPPNALLRKQGMNAYERGGIERADERFSLAVAQDPTDWKSQYYLGLVRLKQGRPHEAQLLLERALSLRAEAAETPDVIDALAESLYQQKEFVKLNALLQDSARAVGDARSYLRLGTFLGRAGDVDNAVVAYRKAIRFADDDDPAPYVALADFYESIGDRANALTALRQAYGLAPGSSRLADRLRQHGIVPGPTVALPPQRD